MYCRFFTSVPLLESACSTIMRNRKGFPNELKNPKFIGRGDAEQRQHDNLVATAWIDAKTVGFFVNCFIENLKHFYI